MEEAWELVYVEIRGPFVVFYRDVDGDGPNGMSGTRVSAAFSRRLV